MWNVFLPFESCKRLETRCYQNNRTEPGSIEKRYQVRTNRKIGKCSFASPGTSILTHCANAKFHFGVSFIYRNKKLWYYITGNESNRRYESEETAYLYQGL